MVRLRGTCLKYYYVAKLRPLGINQTIYRTALPSPRFSRGIGLVLVQFRWKILTVAGCGFLGFFLSTHRFFWAFFKNSGICLGQIFVLLLLYLIVFGRLASFITNPLTRPLQINIQLAYLKGDGQISVAISISAPARVAAQQAIFTITFPPDQNAWREVQDMSNIMCSSGR